LVYCLSSRGKTAAEPHEESNVTRKHILVFALIVLTACGLSGLVAYRRGFHQAQSAPAPGGQSEAGCVTIQDAAAHAGETGCVSARVLRVYTSRAGNTFLDFCADYRHCPFTSVIFSSDKQKFGNLGSLAGRRVEIRGAITVYNGKPEIIIRDPDQVRAAP
jgi:hypothetical protein